MKGTKELTGTLRGFDDYVNMVLDAVVEYNAEGEVVGKLDEVLLNGNNVAVLVPGGGKDKAEVREEREGGI